MKKLSDVSVARTSAPRTGFKVLWDGATTGLGLKVTAAGRRLFILKLVYPGHPAQSARTLGRYPELSLVDARAKAQKWYSLAKAGIDPAVEEAKAIESARRAAMLSQERSFGSVAEAYIERGLNGQRWKDRVARQIRNELIPIWGEKPIAEIDRLDVVALIETIQRRSGGKGSYARNILQVASAVFNWAVDRETFGIEVSPCARIRPAKLLGAKRIRTRVLTDAELAGLWKACGELGYPYGPLVRMLVLTGCRLSEVAEAEWIEFDLPNRIWTIPAERFKSNTTHIIPITDDLMTLLEGLPRHGDFLFSANGAKPVNGFTKTKNRLGARMGDIPPWTFHDIRRTVRTRLSELRVPEHIAEMVIGHARKGLARIYDQHRFAVEIREALESWALRLRQIVDPTTAPNVVQLRRGGEQPRPV